MRFPHRRDRREEFGDFITVLVVLLWLGGSVFFALAGIGRISVWDADRDYGYDDEMYAYPEEFPDEDEDDAGRSCERIEEELPEFLTTESTSGASAERPSTSRNVGPAPTMRYADQTTDGLLVAPEYIHLDPAVYEGR